MLQVETDGNRTRPSHIAMRHGLFQRVQPLGQLRRDTLQRIVQRNHMFGVQALLHQSSP